ncbi:MAG TPA: hypothetical protein VE596_12895 [Gaiellaceae bacterium]|jgi:hypothetical protein|nr:hypothetical protein [Gaiellaceae bacterium]
MAGFGLTRVAPSYPPRRTAHPTPPAEIVRRVLARFGDRSYIRRVELGPPPPITLRHLKGWFNGVRPPRDGLWAYISASTAVAPSSPHPTPKEARDYTIADWEVQLLEGALRDEFCAAGGRPLLGWSLSGFGRGVSDRSSAFGQRFPNPKPRAFRARVAEVGRQYGFTVSSLRLLRPLDYAPLLVVSTDRDRKEFVHDVPAIMALLNPTSDAERHTAFTFEGFFLEARDAKGPFVRVEGIVRGEQMSGEWSWDRCVYPYAHSQPVGAPPCPS